MDTLKEEQEKTLQSPVLPANLILRFFIKTMDILYGKERTLLKFKVLEILARYPYMAWERGCYRKITLLSTQKRASSDQRIEKTCQTIDWARAAYDNEQYHLFLIEELMEKKGFPQDGFMGFWMPRLLAFGYNILSFLLYLIQPRWSYDMNAKFESHAEHEYMKMVAENPQWEEEFIESKYFGEDAYPPQKTVADLFRQIGLDERKHMLDSLQAIEDLKNRVV